MFTAHFTRALCLILSMTVVATPVAAQAAATGQSAKLSPAMDPAKLKTRLINVPTGSPLRVKTRDGAEVAGTLTALTNEGMQIQALVGGNIESRTLPFSDIDGLKTGVKKTGLMSKLSPVMTVLSLLGTVGALTAAFK